MRASGIRKIGLSGRRPPRATGPDHYGKLSIMVGMRLTSLQVHRRKAAVHFHFPAAAVRRRVLPTPSGRSDFRKPADRVRRDSASFAASKLPFVTSRTRPRPAVRPAGRVAARTTAPLGLLPDGQLPLLVLSKVRQEGRARNNAVAGGGVRTSDKRVHFV